MFLNTADCNLTVSDDFAQMLLDSGINTKIHVWKSGVDASLFNPKYRNNETRMKMFNGYYSSDKILLLTVGRISPEKNFEFLMDVIKRFPKAFLCVVGDGPYRSELEKVFPKDKANFIGFLTGEDLASVYASADYFLYASVTETFGQVYLEAMSSGLPIVAAKAKNMDEFFIEGVHGYTWEPCDVDSACKALKNTIKNTNKIIKNCRSRALEFSWEKSTEQLLQFYSQCNYENQSSKNTITFVIKSIHYAIIFFCCLFLYIIIILSFKNRFKYENHDVNESKKNKQQR